MNKKKHSLKAIEVIDLIEAIPFETYNSFPKILFAVKAKIGGKKMTFEGIMKVMGEKQFEFDFDEDLKDVADFCEWMEEFKSVLTFQLFEEAYLMIKIREILDNEDEEDED